jgi:arginase family enzyme
VIGRYSPQRILPLGGECSVSVAPFSWLAERYGDDLPVLWIDSHPDVGTPADVVGLTIAELIPRQVIRLQQVLRNFPLL